MPYRCQKLLYVQVECLVYFGDAFQRERVKGLSGPPMLGAKKADVFTRPAAR